jgi:peptide subunit release factor 1 (eRF1)
MIAKLQVHEGTIRPSLVAEVEAFRAPERWVSSYYLDLDSRHPGNTEVTRQAVKKTLAKQRERLDQLDVRPALRHALHRDWEEVQELALLTVGQRGTRSLACFIASESGHAWALRLPWPVRDRAFFEDRFVLWPLYLILNQADRYAVCLTDKDDARLFLFYLEQIEEVSDVLDEISGRSRFPDPFRELEYMRKHIKAFHHHFEEVAGTALRLFQREPFEHLIIGGPWETLRQFEGHLHCYPRDRIVARWDIDVHTPTPQIVERARQEEQQFLQRQAQDIWKAIQDQRPQRGALGLEEVFAALWQRRVQALLVEPDVVRPGFRCSACGRLRLSGDPCVECGGKMIEVPDIYEEAVHEAVEQSSQVRYWKDSVLSEVDSIAAFRRF